MGTTATLAPGEPDASAWTEPRETAATTTALVLGHVRRQGGEAAVASLLARAGVPFSASELEDPARWFSYRTRIRLLEAAVQVLGDPGAAFAIGATALDNLPPGIVLLIRAAGTPRRVFRQLPTAVTKFSTTSTMEVLDTAAGAATIRYRLHAGYRHSRLDCQYAQGLMSAVPRIFSLPPARVRHPACESDGHPACRYEITWQRRRPLSRLLSARRADEPELRALRGQLRALQSAASDLVGSDEIGVTLARITERAASAVVAPAYLLAVHGPDGGEPLVHSAGLDPVSARASAVRLLDDGDLGPNAVVVDVATARRRYGRLAALYGPDQRGLADEASLLSAYAAHAAAALELLFALEGSRRAGARARDLLALAHRLAVTEQEQDVAEVLADAIPAIIGAPRATVLRWDAAGGELRAMAVNGLAPAERAALLAAGLRPHDTPELARMLTRQEPSVLRAGSSSGALDGLLAEVGAGDVLAVPLLAGETLLGVVTASHGPTGPSTWPDQEAIDRLRGVADQAASAMHNARLLAQVRHQAQHDGLTGLPNRAPFMDTLRRQLGASSNAEDAETAVLFCDLDSFKDVNDRLGHAAGDELLRQVAARLRAVLRAGDLVARLSGDEFALLVTGPDVSAVAGEVADRITDGFATPFRVDDRELRISTSVGVAVERVDDDGDRLLARADAAMYVAKQRGRNQVAVADEGSRGIATSRSSVEELRAGLVEGAFELHYQPIVRLEPGRGAPGPRRVIGYEALARWRHPQLGLLTPAAFLPLAEEAGCVVDLDLWALRTAVAATSTWWAPDRPPQVAVNLSPQTLADGRLVAVIGEAVAGADLDPTRLTVEIAESRSVADLSSMAAHLAHLRRLGVRVALDGFGTGCATLTWLQRLPIDQIKLDRSFMSALDDTDGAPALIVGVLALARALEIEVVAEGVETERQLAAARSAGCRLVQGHLFGAPERFASAGTA